MAQGDLLLFNEFSLQVSSGQQNLAAAGNVIEVALIDSLPVITQSTPTLADFTEVTGAGYAAIDIQTGQSLTVVSGPTYKYDSSVNPAWTQNGSGPVDIVAGLLYNSTVSDRGIAFIDMTVDGGSTPVSLVAGNVSITWNASGIFLIG